MKKVMMMIQGRSRETEREEFFSSSRQCLFEDSFLFKDTV